MPKRPNIVIFNPDQWRWDVMGHMGNAAARTPVVDELVRTEAVSFRQAFCQNTVCTPSRCSFMTGWYPHVRGHRTMHHMLHVEHGEPVLLKVLRDAGYFVWWGGKNDLVPGQGGFEGFCDVKYEPPQKPRPFWAYDRQDRWRGPRDGDAHYSFYVGKLPADAGGHYHDPDWAWVQGACEFIRGAPRDKPLCVYLPLVYPHPPYAVEEPWYGLIDRAKLPPRAPAPESWDLKPSILRGIAQMQNLRGWTEDRWTELRAVYYGMCSRLDHQLGMVLDALRQAGIYDDTAVFLFSDHGDFTGDYGLVEKTQNTFEDVLSRVPLVIKPPKSTAVRPRVTDAIAELVDFPATVYELTGLSPRYTHFGRSLVGVLQGRTDEHRDAAFCEGGRLDGENHCKELDSTAHMKDPAQSLYWPRLRWQQGDGPEHTKAVMCRTRDHKYVRRLYDKDELYDLRTDPAELNNRIDDPAMSGVLDRLRQRMLTWFLQTGDVVPWDVDKR